MLGQQEFDTLGILAGTLGEAARVYHVGFVVPDLDTAIEDLGSALGLTFIEPVEVAGLTLHTPDGERDDVKLRFSYSTRPAHVELVEQASAPDTLWDFNSRQRGHHIGVFTDDVNAEAAALSARGWTQVWWASAPDGTLIFSYHETPFGFYIELVSRAGRLFFVDQFAAADPELTS